MITFRTAVRKLSVCTKIKIIFLILLFYKTLEKITEPKYAILNQFKERNGSKMNHEEFNKEFIASIEKERIALEYTQEEMADALGLSLSAYKRIISGKTEKIDLYLSYKMYEVTNRMSYELVGYSDRLVDTFTSMKQLSAEELTVVDDLVKLLSFSRTYTSKHKELMREFNRAPKVEQQAIERILEVYK